MGLTILRSDEKTTVAVHWLPRGQRLLLVQETDMRCWGLKPQRGKKKKGRGPWVGITQEPLWSWKPVKSAWPLHDFGDKAGGKGERRTQTYKKDQIECNILKPKCPTAPPAASAPLMLFLISALMFQRNTRCRPPRKRSCRRLLWPRRAEPSASFQIQHAWKL